jgi:hypothetical protein
MHDKQLGMEPQMTQMNADSQRHPETYAIIGAAMGAPFGTELLLKSPQ